MNNNMFIDGEERLLYNLSSLYSSYGYHQFKMSKFEEYDLYVKNKAFLISDNIITFTDTNGKLMALKPDVTLSIVNSATDDLSGVKKVFYRENVYRPDSESRYFKEIVQMGLECIGNIDNYSVSEALMLASKSLGSIADDYILDVSDISIISEVMDRESVNDSVRDSIIECIKRKNRHELELLCCENSISYVPFKTLMLCEGAPDSVSNVLNGIYDDMKWKELVGNFISVISVLPNDKTRVDFSVIKDTNYYNGIVFSGYISGISSSVLSGGQYDNLMKKMGKKTKAIGFAVYLDKIDDYLYKTPEYDVDTLVIYSATDDTKKVIKLTDELRKNNQSVLASTSIPADIRYKNAINIYGEEVDK